MSGGVCLSHEPRGLRELGKIHVNNRNHLWTDSECGTIVESYFILQESCECSAMVTPAHRVGNRSVQQRNDFEPYSCESQADCFLSV